MQLQPSRHFELSPLLVASGLRTSRVAKDRNHVLYAQGDPADSIFYVQRGHVKLSVLSGNGKEAVVAIARAGDFFGEACLSGQAFRNSGATTLSKCVLTKIPRDEMAGALRSRPALAQFFLSYVLSRNLQIEAELVDQLCNSCEQRLARILLLLADIGESDSATVSPNVNQETLAAMVGTTRPRISFLLNKFRKEGLIEYGDTLQVNSSLANVLRERALLSQSASAQAS